MKGWEANVRKVIPYVPGEQPKETDIIKLNTNENPYPPSPMVLEALQKVKYEDLRLYPDPEISQLVHAIAADKGLEAQVYRQGEQEDIGIRHLPHNQAGRLGKRAPGGGGSRQRQVQFLHRGR